MDLGDHAKKGGDTSDTGFCGNWFPRGESIDKRGSQRLQGNHLLSARCDRCSMNSETWRVRGASLRILPPRPFVVNHSNWTIEVSLPRAKWDGHHLPNQGQ